MKKKFFYGIAVLVTATVATWNVNLGKSDELSDVFLANVEALAQESGSRYSCSASANCYYGSQVEGSVSCTGTTTCVSGFEYVRCDGKTSKCE
ncbi:MAG: NVEALA domain-containing protein [Tannerella sp.]|nr:NVEALA domain-containing protein [Tannerella sp.]